MPVICLSALRSIPYPLTATYTSQDPLPKTMGRTVRRLQEASRAFILFRPPAVLPLLLGSSTSQWAFLSSVLPGPVEQPRAPDSSNPLFSLCLSNPRVKWLAACYYYLVASLSQFDLSALLTLWGKKLISVSSFENRANNNGQSRLQWGLEKKYIKDIVYCLAQNWWKMLVNIIVSIF